MFIAPTKATKISLRSVSGAVSVVVMVAGRLVEAER